MKPGLAALAVLMILPLTSCGSQVDPAEVTTTRGSDCPPPDAAGSASIDWVPFVRVKGLMFQATTSPRATVTESDLGATVLSVACEIGDTVSNPDYQPRDGDSAYLARGSELREIVGYRPDFRLAAWDEGAWHVYEVDDVPDARTGEDMVDLRDKVTAIHLVEGERGERILKTVDDEPLVATVVDAVLAAPVLPETSSFYDRLSDESPVFVRFDMIDGTAVQRAWHVTAGVLWRRIEVPPVLEETLSPRAP